MHLSIIAAIIVSLYTISAAAADVPEGLTRHEQVRYARQLKTRKLMQETLREHVGTGYHPSQRPLQFAMAALWLNRRTDEANERLRQAYGAILKSGPESPSEVMTPSLAYTQKWGSMRMWLRIYYLFGSSSSFHPGRLAPDVEAQMRDLFWNFALGKIPPLRRAQSDCIWLIMNSENHDMMDYGNSFLALQALRNHPDYRDRVLPDGHRLTEYVSAWTEYYKRYCDTRADSGLFVEISPTYGKWFLPELINIHDFADDPVLRRKMEMLLHLACADWAIDQLNGIRGGAKTRVYPDHYSSRGGSDSWSDMMRTMLDLNGDWEKNHYLNTLIPYYYILGTTTYEVPDLIMDLALDDGARGEYEYVSLRPGKLAVQPDWVAPKVEEYRRWNGVWGTALAYWMDGRDPRAARYGYCTPDYILGSWLDDPDTEYAGIHTQNRWQGIIFSTGPDARVYPECMVTQKKANYLQHQAVQYKNVLIVQKSRKSRDAGEMRVRFASGMKQRIIEQDGWLFLEEGMAYLAVRVFGADPYQWVDGNYIACRDEHAPVVFVAGRKAEHPTLDAFMAYARSVELNTAAETLTCSFHDPSGRDVTLGMDIGRQTRRVTINGKPVDLSPEKVFDSPYLTSKRGTGKATICKGSWKLELDFGNAVMRETGRPGSK